MGCLGDCCVACLRAGQVELTSVRNASCVVGRAETLSAALINTALREDT